MAPSAVTHFVVHNFGFGGGWRGFQAEADISYRVQANMLRGVYHDIAYSCAVGLSGASYEYRGWDTSDGATFGYFGRSISCALIMNGATEQATPEMQAEVWRLFRLAQAEFPGIQLTWHTAAQQACKCGSPTSCPGPFNLGWLLAGPIDVQEGTLELDFGKTVARGYQRILVDAGYDLGSFGPDGDGVDGEFGTVSVNALKNFQRDMGVQSTGTWDSATDIAYTGWIADRELTPEFDCCELG